MCGTVGLFRYCVGDVVGAGVNWNRVGVGFCGKKHEKI